MGYFENEDDEKIREEVANPEAHYERERARYEAEGIDDSIVLMAARCFRYYRLIQAGFPSSKFDIPLPDWYVIAVITEWFKAKEKETFYTFFSGKK
jgi:hypothetical protein